MAVPSDTRQSARPDPDSLPFVAPCRQVGAAAPLRWLRLGWRDLRRAPRQSLSYGAFFVAVSYLVSLLAWELGSPLVLLGMLSGFVFLGPVLAIGLYSISYQLQRGLAPRIGYCVREGKRHLGNEMIFAFILVIVFLVWARAASMVHVFFPVEAHPRPMELVVFFGVGSAVGSIFAAIVFAAAAFSLPMIMDRKVDMVTAVVTSINAVLRNKGTMVVWAGLIVVSVAVGFVTAFLGLAVLLPVIGHATWHAYQETIDAGAWPRHEED
ncbi:MAG: DUF2189 domain-containing protein [Gammaproteobacteria bacterium]